MLKQFSHRLTSFVLVFLLLATWPIPGRANSAEPPATLLIVPNSDVSVVFYSGETPIRTNWNELAWEKYYLAYHGDINTKKPLYAQVEYKGTTFQCEVGSGTYTLDLDAQAASPGKSILRSILLVGIRLTLTLLIEGLLFFFFGYRLKKSWLVFLMVNLVTQAGLNIYINTFSPALNYAIISLFFAEVLILLIELITLPLLITEKKKGITVLYTILANLLSLILGGFLITQLPI